MINNPNSHLNVATESHPWWEGDEKEEQLCAQSHRHAEVRLCVFPEAEGENNSAAWEVAAFIAARTDRQTGRQAHIRGALENTEPCSLTVILIKCENLSFLPVLDT